jgi:hypothetical protein
MSESDAIPIIETYRGVGLQDQQTPERLAVVRQAIDLVFAEHDFGRLFEIADDAGRPPEARLFAAAKLQAAHEIAVQDREKRPLIDLVHVQASIAGLNSLRWRHPVYFGSLLDPGPGPGEIWPKREMQAGK